MKGQVFDGQHQTQDLIRQLDNLSRELEYLRKEIGSKDYEIQRLRTSGGSHGTIPVGSDLKEFLTQSQNVILFYSKNRVDSGLTMTDTESFCKKLKGRI